MPNDTTPAPIGADALREALWICVEHNALHFGETHNTVVQGRAALASAAQPEVERPNSAGPWLWREAGHKDAVELLLTEDGGEVAGVDDAEEGTPQYYWEGTPTDKRHMPGQWHLPANA